MLVLTYNKGDEVLLTLCRTVITLNRKKSMRHNSFEGILNMSRLMIKPTKWHVRPAKTQISLGICPAWSESSLSAWRKFGSLAAHWAHSKDSDQTGRMPRLIWVFAGRTVILLVLSWGGSYLLGSVWCRWKAVIRNRCSRIPHLAPETKRERNTRS